MREEDLVVGHQQPNVVHHAGKSRKFLKILLTVLLIAGLAASAYLYQSDTQKLNKLENENTNLTDTVAQKDELISKLRKGLVDGQGGSCDAGASYAADVGKFKVKLNEPNVIVRNLDANFEGGPASILDVASCIEGQMNVFDKPPQKEVTITANPNLTAEDLKTAYESNYGEPESTGSVTVAGVTAEKNLYTGLFAPTAVFFENEGVGYQIELADTNEELEAILTDIIDDWEFTAAASE